MRLAATGESHEPDGYEQVTEGDVRVETGLARLYTVGDADNAQSETPVLFAALAKADAIGNAPSRVSTPVS